MKTRSRHIVALSALTLSFLFSGGASALPAPMSEADMLAAADLVVDASCTSIVCHSGPTTGADKVTTIYLSVLDPSHTYKGELPASLEILGKVEEWLGEPRIGGWFQPPVPKGWAGKLYLKKEVDGTYSEVWWNGMFEDTNTSAPEALPTCSAAADGGVDDGAPADDGGPADQATPVADSGPEADSGPAADSGPTADATQGADSAVRIDSGTSSSSDGGCGVGGQSAGEAPLFSVALLLLFFTLRRRR